MISPEPILASEQIISHCVQEPLLEEVVRSIKEEVLQRGDLPYVSAEEICHLIDEALAFELGKFLLKNKGLNAYWTHCIVVEAPQWGEGKKGLSELEQFCLFRAPVVLATQERYKIFQRECQKRLFSHCVFASAPCGLMAELIDLDFIEVSPAKLVGIDLDDEALRGAERYAVQQGRDHLIELRRVNIWELNCSEEFDLLTSAL